MHTRSGTANEIVCVQLLIASLLLLLFPEQMRVHERK